MLLESVETGASGVAKVAAGGSSFFLRFEDWLALGRDPAELRAGAELDEAGESALRLAAEAREAGLAGAALLARAEQTRLGLGAKLEKRGFGARAVRLALDRLEAEGLLDEGRYARAWLRSRLAGAKEGPRRLLQALRARGLDEETARAALAAELGGEERRSLYLRAKARLERRLAEPEAIRDALRELGFTSTELRAFEDEDDGP